MKTQLKKAAGIVGAAAIMMFASCKKDTVTPDKPVDPTPPTTTVAKGNITNLTFVNNGAANPSLINLGNNSEKANIANYSATSGGTIQLKISGKDGRDVLKAEDVVGLSSNAAKWHINAGDTVRIYQSGSLKGEYVTVKGDGVNDGIVFSITEGEAQDHAMTRFNTYVKTTLPTQQFKAL